MKAKSKKSSGPPRPSIVEKTASVWGPRGSPAAETWLRNLRAIVISLDDEAWGRHNSSDVAAMLRHFGGSFTRLTNPKQPLTKRHGQTGRRILAEPELRHMFTPKFWETVRHEPVGAAIVVSRVRAYDEGFENAAAQWLLVLEEDAHESNDSAHLLAGLAHMMTTEQDLQSALYVNLTFSQHHAGHQHEVVSRLQPGHQFWRAGAFARLMPMPTHSGRTTIAQVGQGARSFLIHRTFATRLITEPWQAWADVGAQWVLNKMIDEDRYAVKALQFFPVMFTHPVEMASVTRGSTRLAADCYDFARTTPYILVTLASGTFFDRLGTLVSAMMVAGLLGYGVHCVWSQGCAHYLDLFQQPDVADVHASGLGMAYVRVHQPKDSKWLGNKALCMYSWSFLLRPDDLKPLLENYALDMHKDAGMLASVLHACTFSTDSVRKFAQVLKPQPQFVEAVERCMDMLAESDQAYPTYSVYVERKSMQVVEENQSAQSVRSWTRRERDTADDELLSFLDRQGDGVADSGLIATDDPKYAQWIWRTQSGKDKARWLIWGEEVYEKACERFQLPKIRSTQGGQFLQMLLAARFRQFYGTPNGAINDFILNWAAYPTTRCNQPGNVTVKPSPVTDDARKLLRQIVQKAPETFTSLYGAQLESYTTDQRDLIGNVTETQMDEFYKIVLESFGVGAGKERESMSFTDLGREVKKRLTWWGAVREQWQAASGNGASGGAMRAILLRLQRRVQQWPGKYHLVINGSTQEVLLAAPAELEDWVAARAGVPASSSASARDADWGSEPSQKRRRTS